MAVPKRRQSTRRKGLRRASKNKSLGELVVCKECGKLKRSHRTCPYCNK